MLALIRVAPKTTLYYLMENTALRLYANVTHRVRHFSGPISMISVDKQAKDPGLIAPDICPENISSLLRATRRLYADRDCHSHSTGNLNTVLIYLMPHFDFPPVSTLPIDAAGIQQDPPFPPIPVCRDGPG